MRFSALALLAVGVRAASDVLDLRPQEWDGLILEKGRPTFVEFFAPWCGHCKNLAPTWEELGTAFAHASNKVAIGKVDADAHRDLGSRYGVQGFPTLKWFDGKSDKPEDYNGGRDLDSLIAFVEKKSGAKSKQNKAVSHVRMLTDTTFNKTIGKAESVLVAFTAPWCGHCKSLAPIYEQLASSLQSESSVVIAKVDAEDEGSKKVAREQKIESYPTLKWFPSGSSEPQAYTSGRTEEAFLEFINKEAGTHRAPGGRLTATAGIIPAVDTIIQNIIDSGDVLSKRSDEVLAAAKVAAGPYAKYYTKVVEKIVKNEGYAAKELARLEKLVKGKISAEKRDDLESRINVLRKFLVTKAEQVKEKVEEVKDEVKEKLDDKSEL